MTKPRHPTTDLRHRGPAELVAIDNTSLERLEEIDDISMALLVVLQREVTLSLATLSMVGGL